MLPARASVSSAPLLWLVSTSRGGLGGTWKVGGRRWEVKGERRERKERRRDLRVRHLGGRRRAGRACGIGWGRRRLRLIRACLSECVCVCVWEYTRERKAPRRGIDVLSDCLYQGSIEGLYCYLNLICVKCSQYALDRLYALNRLYVLCTARVGWRAEQKHGWDQRKRGETECREVT